MTKDSDEATSVKCNGQLPCSSCVWDHHHPTALQLLLYLRMQIGHTTDGSNIDQHQFSDDPVRYCALQILPKQLFQLKIASHLEVSKYL